MQDIVDGKDTARFQHPASLGIDGILGRNVHRRVKGHGRIEGPCVERQLRGVAASERHLVLQADPRRELGRCPAESRVEIQSGDVAVVRFGDGAGGAAKSATDIKHAGSRTESHPRRQLERRRPAARMELVDGGEIARGQGIELLAGGTQALGDAFRQPGIVPVVCRHRIGHGPQNLIKSSANRPGWATWGKWSAPS